MENDNDQQRMMRVDMIIQFWVGAYTVTANNDAAPVYGK